MVDAANYNQVETLKNGIEVRIRSIRPDDKKRLVEAFKNLDPESIYTRFFYHKKMLTEEELKSATELDFENAVALVVTTGEGEQETIIGAGRYVVIDETDKLRSAEVAFTIEEDYHRQGMARILLQHLASIAREKGLYCFVAEVLPENRGMLTVFSRSGLPMKTEHGGDAMHVTHVFNGGGLLIMYQNLAILAAFVLVYSAVAGRIEKTPISGAIVAMGFGFACGPLGLGIFTPHVDGELLRTLAELTLALVLFTDAANANLSVLKISLQLPERLLLIGLPLTILLGFGFGFLVFPGMALFELAVLATMLAPTDAALGKAVVTNPNVPATLRESLNVESGLNDGICVPILFVFLALASRCDHG